MENTGNQPVAGGQGEIQSLKAEIKELKDLTVENQRMIRSVYKRMRFSGIITAIKWVIIIGITLGAFYYIQPVFEAVLKTYESIGGLGSSQNGQNVIDLLKSF